MNSSQKTQAITISKQQANQLQLLLANIRETVSHLQLLLIKEQELLKKRPKSDHLNLTEEKDLCIKKVAKLSQSLENFILNTKHKNHSKQNMPITFSHLNTIIDLCPNPFRQQLKDSWLALQKLLKDTQRQNNINGLVIQQAEKNTMKILSILTGKSIYKTSLYGADGQTHCDTEHHNLAQA